MGGYSYFGISPCIIYAYATRRCLLLRLRLLFVSQFCHIRINHVFSCEYVSSTCQECTWFLNIYHKYQQWNQHQSVTSIEIVEGEAIYSLSRSVSSKTHHMLTFDALHCKSAATNGWRSSSSSSSLPGSLALPAFFRQR